MINTRSIDYFLLSLWLSSKLSQKVVDIINQKQFTFYTQLQNIIRLIDNDEWDRSRTIWALSINESTPNDQSQFCFFSTEREVNDDSNRIKPCFTF